MAFPGALSSHVFVEANAQISILTRILGIVAEREALI